MGLDEAFGLYEHARRAAAGVVDAALVRLQHFDQEAHDAARREEFAAELALSLRELGEEVLVDAAERVARLGAVALEPDVGDQVDQALHLLRRNAAAGVVARQLAFEIRIVALDGKNGVIDQRRNVLRLLFLVAPSPPRAEQPMHQPSQPPMRRVLVKAPVPELVHVDHG